MASNGQLPASALKPIAGGGQLANDAAKAWNALAAHVYKKQGYKISASEGYRTLDRQWYFWNLHQSGTGNLAAYPGTSNHGWGLAVDLHSYTDRLMIDKYGAKFGWSKSWSDAPSEWWHIKYQPGHYHGPNPGTDYVAGPKKPKWWDRVKARLRANRKRYAHKKDRRRKSDRPNVRERLHRQLAHLRDWIKRTEKRLAKHDGWRR